MTLMDLMHERLAALNPTHIEIQDDSAKHAGHAGSSGGGHYRLVIVSERFKNMNAVSRHRAVYDALGDLMGERIHALSISAFTPEDIQTKQDQK